MIPQVGNLVSYRGAIWLVYNVTGSLLDLVRLTGAHSKCKTRVTAQKVKTFQ